MEKNTIYLALYNELFMNGQRTIGNGNTVEFFDRNRLYGAVGYVIQDGLKVQLGVMNQTTDSWGKNQIQLSLHHSFYKEVTFATPNLFFPLIIREFYYFQTDLRIINY